MFSQHGSLVKLEDAEFEKHFVTYADNQQEARYALSHAIIARILALKQKFDSQISLGFVGGRGYVAIAMAPIFEVSGADFDEGSAMVEPFFELLQSLVGIVHDLNLNQRIWTKA